MPFLTGLAALLAFTATMNLLLLRRPRRGGDASLIVLIPARDEAANLVRLLPVLKAQGLEMVVLDDESTDGTGDVATPHATVIRPTEGLPDGWTGKNRAMHLLGEHALKGGAEWLVFLDADLYPEPGFADALRAECAGARDPVISGIPRVLPGEGIEPLFMAWIGWIILATNPFWIVRLTGLGHNRFLNGQVHAWRRDVYAEIQPWSALRGKIMEDVGAARLLARRGRAVTTLDLSSVLGVRMYRTWRETLDGFSKNAYEITGSWWGTFLLALLLVALAVACASPWVLVLLILSGLAVARTARAPIWPALLLPVGLLIGAFTLVRSWWWRRTGRVRWKGRVYQA